MFADQAEHRRKPTANKDEKVKGYVTDQGTSVESKSLQKDDLGNEALPAAQREKDHRSAQLPPVTSSEVKARTNNTGDHAQRSETERLDYKSHNAQTDTPADLPKCVDGGGQTLPSEEISGPAHLVRESTTTKLGRMEVSSGIAGKSGHGLPGYKDSSDCPYSVVIDDLPELQRRTQTTATETAGAPSADLKYEHGNGTVEAKDKPIATEDDAMHVSLMTGDMIEINMEVRPVSVLDSDTTSIPKECPNEQTQAPEPRDGSECESQHSQLSFAGKTTQAADIYQPVSGDKEENQQTRRSERKEVATMTASMDLCLPPRKTCQDVEVQAVANVCSRSAGTSPCLFPAPVFQTACLSAKEESEILAVVGQVELRTRLVFQTPTCEALFCGAGDASGVDTQKITRCQVHVDATQYTDRNDIGHLLEAVRLDAGICNRSESSGPYQSKSQLHQDTTGSTNLPPLQPAYQINIEACQQSDKSIDHPDNKGTLAVDLSHETGSELCDINNAMLLKEGLCEKPTPYNICQAGGSVTEPAQLIEMSAPNDTRPCAKSGGSKKTKLQFASELDPTELMARNNENNIDHQDGPAGHLSGGPEEKQEPAALGPGAPSDCHTGLEDEGGEEGWAGSGARRQSEEGAAVQDVVWDEQGMTWEVYGASVDPESLGFAIQSHLQTKIREQERKVRAIRKSITSETSQGKRGKKKPRGVFRVLLQGIRRPACCGRPAPSAVLD